MPRLCIEYAKSGRAKCSFNSCKKPIAKHELRIGTEVPIAGMIAATTGAETDGTEVSYKWRHLCCFTDRQLSNARASGDIDRIENYDLLAPADKTLVDRMRRGELVGKPEGVLGRVGDVVNSKFLAAAKAAGKASGAAAGTAAAPKRGRPSSSSASASGGDGTAGAKPPAAKRARKEPAGAKSSKKKKTGGGGGADDDDADSQATEEYEVEVVEGAARPRCPFGANCFRTNKEHFEQYDHSGEAGGENDDDDDDDNDATNNNNGSKKEEKKTEVTVRRPVLVKKK